MARNDTSNFRNQLPHRAQPRPGDVARATSWRALVNTVVASTLVVALFVSALALLEAVLTNPASTTVAQRSPSSAGSQHWRADAWQPVQFSNR